MKRVCVGSSIAVLILAASLALAGTATAAGLKLCVPKKENSATLTPKHGKCRKGYKLEVLGAQGNPGATGKTGAEGKAGPSGPEGKQGLSSGEVETLKAILPFIKFVSAGVGSKPTIQFSGANVQIVNGLGKTETTNGAGNLIVGYDEDEAKREQTGSHDLVLGKDQSFTSYGGIVAGLADTITGPYASVTGGFANEATGNDASVSGGEINAAETEGASVSGGEFNHATGIDSSISGGFSNEAQNFQSSVSGGEENIAAGEFSSVSGGDENDASGKWAAILGGGGNIASGEFSSIGGEQNKKATEKFEFLP